MSQSKLMLFFSSATEKRKRDSDDSDESQPGPSTPKKTSSDIYNDTTSISCKRSVCDPLKLKMTPKVNYLGVTMTPDNFFEGKTLPHHDQKSKYLDLSHKIRAKLALYLIEALFNAFANRADPDQTALVRAA